MSDLLMIGAAVGVDEISGPWDGLLEFGFVEACDEVVQLSNIFELLASLSTVSQMNMNKKKRHNNNRGIKHGFGK